MGNEDQKKTAFLGGCERKFQGSRGTEGEEERKSSTNRYWPCSGAGLEGVFPLSIGESGRMEQVLRE